MNRYPRDSRPQTQEEGFRKIARILWRNKIVIAICMAVGCSVAQLIRLDTIPNYESEAQVILDVRNTPLLKFDSVGSALVPQPEVVRTEMDIISSRGMAERILAHIPEKDALDLAGEAYLSTPLSRMLSQFWVNAGSGPYEWLRRLAQRAGILPTKERDAVAAASGQPTRDDLINVILGGLKISNDGRSYTIHISFDSAHPRLAALLANTYAEQYIDNQLDMKAAAVKRANEWLSQRLVDLRHQLEQSETAVETYRRAAGMLGEDRGTIITQQISEINAELAAARNQRIEAESRLLIAQSQMKNGGDLEALSDVLSSQAVQSLRAKQADLSRQQTQLNSQYTAKYPNAKTLQTDISSLQKQLADEVARVIKSLGNQVAIARSKEAGLQQDLARLQKQFGEGGGAEVKLKQLQREADANRSLYEAFLNRFKELTEQQQLEQADAHLVSSASVPVVPTYPRFRPMLALGLAMGLGAGIVLAILRDMFDRRLLSVGQVEDATGLPVLALMPSLPRFLMTRPEEYVLGRRGSLFNEALRTTWAAVCLGAAVPNSDHASVLFANDPGRGRRRRRPAGSDGIVVLVTSSIPNEGKTAFCLSMARTLAADGHRVLLIDGDMRRPGVAKSLGGEGEGRLVDLLSGSIELQDAIQVDTRSGAHYLSAGRGSAHPQDVLNSIRTEIVLDVVRRSYDFILVDTPPILVAADAAIVARYCDRCLFFVRWGLTSRDIVMSGIRRLMLYNVKVSGVVLSHVNMRRHAQYATGDGYYQSYGDLPRLPAPMNS